MIEVSYQDLHISMVWAMLLEDKPFSYQLAAGVVQLYVVNIAVDRGENLDNVAFFHRKALPRTSLNETFFEELRACPSLRQTFSLVNANHTSNYPRCWSS